MDNWAVDSGCAHSQKTLPHKQAGDADKLGETGRHTLVHDGVKQALKAREHSNKYKASMNA